MMKNSVARTQPGKSYAHIPSADNLPIGIGANFHDDPINRSTQRKSHNLLLERKWEYAPHTEYFYSGGTVPRRFRTSMNSASSAGGGESSSDDNDIWDGWFSEDISKEDEAEFVVRMAAYFTEKVDESPNEEERVRRVLIKYFVKDDSIAIVENKELNSGIVQSTILARTRVPKKMNNVKELISLDDFKVGGTVNIYERDYHIVDMDKRSRNYFKQVRNETVPEGSSWPEDAHTLAQRAKMAKSAHRVITSDDMDRKRIVEQQLTGIYTKHSNEDIAIAQQFLKNRINEHLTFLALWDDRGSLSGDLHFCIIRLFLENYAVEVGEALPENSGRVQAPILISRQRIPRPGADLNKSRFQQHTYGKLMKTDYLCPDDFQVGETYDIFGKPFYIYDADEYTRAYLRDNFNVGLKDAIDISPFIRDEEKKVLFFPPPPNGFGSERERRANWITLTAKPAKVDQEERIQNSGRVMNFSALLAKPLVKGDEEREFVISYFMETEEVKIFEKTKRNSGFVGGRFLAKGEHRKELPNGTTRPFQPGDFQVGKEVTIFQRPFVLTGMDEATSNIIAGTAGPTAEQVAKAEASKFDPVEEERKLRRKLQIVLQEKLIQRKGCVQEQFRLLGEHSATCRMNRDVFRRSLNEVLHFNVSKREEDMLVALMFDGREDENHEITYKQFQEFVDACDAW